MEKSREDHDVFRTTPSSYSAMKLNTKDFRYLSSDDWRVLQGVSSFQLLPAQPPPDIPSAKSVLATTKSSLHPSYTSCPAFEPAALAQTDPSPPSQKPVSSRK